MKRNERRRHSLIFKTTGLMILSFLVLLLISTASFAAQERGDPAAQVATELAERWGVRVESMRLTAANHMLDFRYTVLDAEKAAPLFVRKTHPKLLHTKSGARLAVHSGAKVGPMRNSNPPVKGKTYFIIFGNKGGLVKAGDRVDVVIGEFTTKGLVVEG